MGTYWEDHGNFPWDYGEVSCGRPNPEDQLCQPVFPLRLSRKQSSQLYIYIYVGLHSSLTLDGSTISLGYTSLEQLS